MYRDMYRTHGSPLEGVIEQIFLMEWRQVGTGTGRIKLGDVEEESAGRDMKF